MSEKKGLTNIKSITESLKHFLSEKTEKLLAGNSILSNRELNARYEVRLDFYTKKIQIEARVLSDLAINHVIPTAIKYQNTLIINVKGIKDLVSDIEFEQIAGTQLQTIKKISEHIFAIRINVKDIVEKRKKANAIDSEAEKANSYEHNVFPLLDIIRYHIDKLELIVDDEIWPLPKYRELLFSK